MLSHLTPSEFPRPRQPYEGETAVTTENLAHLRAIRRALNEANTAIDAIRQSPITPLLEQTLECLSTECEWYALQLERWVWLGERALEGDPGTLARLERVRSVQATNPQEAARLLRQWMGLDD